MCHDKCYDNIIDPAERNSLSIQRTDKVIFLILRKTCINRALSAESQGSPIDKSLYSFN